MWITTQSLDTGLIMMYKSAYQGISENREFFAKEIAPSASNLQLRLEFHLVQSLKSAEVELRSALTRTVTLW